MQRLPNALPARTPSQFAAGCGARQRLAPTGGAAYGIPLNARTPLLMPATPDTSPFSTRTWSGIAADVSRHRGDHRRNHT